MPSKLMDKQSRNGSHLPPLIEPKIPGKSYREIVNHSSPRNFGRAPAPKQMMQSCISTYLSSSRNFVSHVTEATLSR